ETPARPYQPLQNDKAPAAEDVLGRQSTGDPLIKHEQTGGVIVTIADEGLDAWLLPVDDRAQRVIDAMNDAASRQSPGWPANRIPVIPLKPGTQQDLAWNYRL